MTTITLRRATADDRAFIDSLSPRLSGVPRPAWHDAAAMEGFQDRHMAASFAAVDGAETLIACAADGRRLATSTCDRPGTASPTSPAAISPCSPRRRRRKARVLRPV